jgi:SAM-dependent methyltransferase
VVAADADETGHLASLPHEGGAAARQVVGKVEARAIAEAAEVGRQLPAERDAGAAARLLAGHDEHGAREPRAMPAPGGGDLMIRLEPVERPHRFGGTDRHTLRALDNLSRANRYFGGTRSVLRWLTPRLAARRGETVRILDVGCGRADITRALVMRARELGVRLRVVAVDADPKVVELARIACAPWPEIEVVQGDARRLPFVAGVFDYVVAAMLLHYFSLGEAARLLDAWRRLARSAVVISDVERHWVPYLCLGLLGRVSSSTLFDEGHRYTVRRGFTTGELRRLGALGGFARIRIGRHVPYRLSLLGVCGDG